MVQWLKRLEVQSKATLALLCIVNITVVGLVDYATGYETFFFIFYLVSVFVGAWFIGTSFGILMSALSVAAWVSANIAAGKPYVSYFVPVWNAMIMFVFYLVVVGLVARLRAFHRELEERVRRRTAALTKETQERLRLQNELLETSEREQQRIGCDLHDGLCQHLTGVALASHVLGEKLADKSLPETAEARRVVEHVERAIELTRSLSRSLHPIDLKTGGLMDNLQELAADINERFKVACRCEGRQIAPLHDEHTARHLYRIAQEAATNAVRHGKARNINIGFNYADSEIMLTVTDDGSGLPDHARKDGGMGLRIMAYRAEMIGATLNIERLPTHGTRVTCNLPTNRLPRASHAN
jgi:signal transduction histidine kinase